MKKIKEEKIQRPFKVFPPGNLLLDELNERGLTQAEFSEIIGRPARTVNEIIKGKRGITPETAGVIGAALGTTPDFWLSLQSNYDLYFLQEKNHKKTEDVKARSELYSLFPVQELVRRKYISARKKAEELKKEIFEILNIKSIHEFKDAELALLRVADGEIETSYLKAWILLGKEIAKEMKVGAFDGDSLLAFSKTIKDYSLNPMHIKKLLEKLNDIGVRVIFLPHFVKTRVDGATFWLTNKEPVVLMSLRYDRVDNFFFTLLHEIGHILLHSSLEQKNFVDIDIYNAENNENEIAANAFAVENLGLVGIAEDLRYKNTTPQLLVMTCQKIGVHPGILIGHLQHKRILDYGQYRKTLVRVKSAIPSDLIKK